MIENFNVNNLKFNCLNNLTVVEAQASDHHPIMMANLCAFNLLCRCQVGGSHANNGFGISELAIEYKERLLNKLFPVISELILEHGISLFAFQEAPPLLLSKNYTDQEHETVEAAREFYHLFSKKFNEYTVETQYYLPMWLGSEACGLLLIYHKDLAIDKDITQETKSIISKKNKQRFQAIQLKRQNQQLLKLVNIHANFENQFGTQQDIEKLIEKQFVIAGDFNLKCWQKIENTVQIVNKTDPGLMPTDTYDGIIMNKLRAQSRPL